MKRLIVTGACCLAIACGPSPKKVEQTPTRGQAKIAVDETFYPLIDGQVRVFESQYRHAEFDIVSCPEQEISKLLRSDSVRLVVLSRELTAGELAWLESKELTPRITEVAYDGIALIVNRDSRDSVLTTGQLIATLQGKAGEGARTLVFDNPASGTVRYMKELAGVDSLPGAYSMQSNREVIEYVASHPSAIGFTGVDWLYEADSLDKQYIDRIKVLAVGDPATGYFKPSQNDIAAGDYPFTRKIYFINCQGTAGLGLGFASFLASDIGQRIALKAGLVPVTYPKREINLRKQL